MKRIVAFLLLILMPAWPENVSAQSGNPHPETLRIGFYNAENYFDPFVDSASSYHEFDPGGSRHWSRERYFIKRQHIFKVLAALGGWKGVDVMAFAEIENRFVLEDLLKNTPLGTKNYGIVHFESPDHRGIDVGLIYKKSVFHPLFTRAVPVYDPSDTLLKTRDILYVKGLAAGDTLHLFINHWPSRYGGLMATVSKRVLAAGFLLRVVDSVCQSDTGARILILGDFNEDLAGKGLQRVLQTAGPCTLRALPSRRDFGQAKGTLRSKEGWTTFDRVLCSKNLLLPKAPVFVVDKSFHIFDAPFLLENDKKNMGFKPYRTYNGFAWQGGFSDHLPVYVDVTFKEAGK